MDPGARTHPGRDALRILLIATLLSNISANYRRITVTPSAAERYNSSLPTQTVFGACRFPVPGNENPDFARSSGSCGRLLGKICPAGFAAFLAQAAAESMSTRTHDWLLFPRGAARAVAEFKKSARQHTTLYGARLRQVRWLIGFETLEELRCAGGNVTSRYFC